jgi:hypothetical protein
MLTASNTISRRGARVGSAPAGFSLERVFLDANVLAECFHEARSVSRRHPSHPLITELTIWSLLLAIAPQPSKPGCGNGRYATRTASCRGRAGCAGALVTRPFKLGIGAATRKFNPRLRRPRPLNFLLRTERVKGKFGSSRRQKIKFQHTFAFNIVCSRSERPASNRRTWSLW